MAEDRKYLQKLAEWPRWKMIHPIMHVLYLCLTHTGDIGKAYKNNSAWEMRYAIRNLAGLKKHKCKAQFFYEGELAWGSVSDTDIKDFLTRYYKTKER